MSLFDQSAQVHKFPFLADRGVQDAIRRYERCWLPLMLQHAGDAAAAPLAAPLDVAWVWLAHAIAPVHYRGVSLRCTSSDAAGIPTPQRLI